MTKLFAFGLGYSALALARRLVSRGWMVTGTTRSNPSPAQVPQGIRMASLSGSKAPEAFAEGFAGTTHLLLSAGPLETGDPCLAQYQEVILSQAGSLQWIGYLSTTGVYGDHRGGWVTEETRLTPQSPRGQRRVMAERQWQDFGRTVQVPVHIFRLAGIYGPGRSAIDSLRDGSARRIVKPGQVFSRIHVEDIASVLEASIAQGGASSVFNVCDDEAAPPQDVIVYAAKLLGMSPPPEEPFEQAQSTMSEMARSFYAESKRVSNAKLKRLLLPALAYPTYREGLRGCLTAP